MSELEERVAKALRAKAAEIDNRPDVHDADAMWFADEYARAALDAIGIDEILDVLRPFAKAFAQGNVSGDFERATDLYCELGGTWAWSSRRPPLREISNG